MSNDTKKLELTLAWKILGVAGTLIFFGFTGWITWVQAQISNTANNVAIVKEALVNTDKESIEKVNTIDNRVTRLETEYEEMNKKVDSISADLKESIKLQQESNKILLKYK